MTHEEINKRQISSNEWTLFDHLPTTNNILTVVYADFKNIFMFDSTGLSEAEKDDLVDSLILVLQSGTNVTRDIAKKLMIYTLYISNLIRRIVLWKKK